MRGTPASRGQSFIARDHRYVYLGGSVIALVGLSLWYSAPSPYSFLPAGSVPGTALAAVCYFFLVVSTLALLVKWTHWSSYGETILKRPALVRLSRYLSYLDAAAAALLALDRFVLKLAYVVHAAVHAESNPTDTLSSMVYMAYNQRSLFVTGVWTTVQLALAGTAIAFVLALLMVFLRIQEPDKRNNDFVKIIKIVANKFARFYIFVIRGTPMMVQSLIFYYAIFNLFKRTGMSVTEINRVWSLFISGLVTVSLNSTAYLAEVLRGGILAVDAGQMEAGRSLGFNFVQTMWYIVIPQALKSVLPALANEFIVLLKETSVACYVAVNDLTKGGEIIRSITYIQAMPLLIVAALYLAMVMFFSSLVTRLERRLRGSER